MKRNYTVIVEFDTSNSGLVKLLRDNDFSVFSYNPFENTKENLNTMYILVDNGSHYLCIYQKSSAPPKKILRIIKNSNIISYKYKEELITE